MAKNKKDKKKKKGSKKKERKKENLNKKNNQKEKVDKKKEKKNKAKNLEVPMEIEKLKEEMPQEEVFFVMKSPLGMLKIMEKEGFLESLDFVNEEEKEPQTKLQKRAKLQLEEYFLEKRKSFDLPLRPKGTEFQERVWKELLNIPYGQTISYGEVARRIDNPKAFRAIGGANGKNPIPILIPCHRVIASNGNISGYTGGVSKKEYLLKLENKEGMEE